jgi:hypothetical protein
MGLIGHIGEDALVAIGQQARVHAVVRGCQADDLERRVVLLKYYFDSRPFLGSVISSFIFSPS